MSDLTSEILSGEWDDRLSQISDAIGERKKQLRAIKQLETRAALKVGDKVRLQNLSPKYINGSVGVVKEFKSTRVVVDLEPGFPGQYRKFGNGQGLRVPLNCVEAV